MCSLPQMDRWLLFNSMHEEANAFGGQLREWYRVIVDVYYIALVGFEELESRSIWSMKYRKCEAELGKGQTRELHES